MEYERLVKDNLSELKSELHHQQMKNFGKINNLYQRKLVGQSPPNFNYSNHVKFRNLDISNITEDLEENFYHQDTL